MIATFKVEELSNKFYQTQVKQRPTRLAFRYGSLHKGTDLYIPVEIPSLIQWSAPAPRRLGTSDRSQSKQ